MVTSSIFSRNAVPANGSFLHRSALGRSSARRVRARRSTQLMAWTLLATGIAVGAACAGWVAVAKAGPGTDAAADAPVALKAELTPTVARPGRTVRAVVKVHVADGFHIQAHKPGDPSMIPTVLTWNAAPALRVGKTVYPVPQTEKLAFSDAPLLVYGETAILRTPVTVKPGTKPGAYKLTGTLRYQACSAEACQAPAKLPVELTVIVKR